jgi:hypothetical protein
MTRERTARSAAGHAPARGPRAGLVAWLLATALALAPSPVRADEIGGTLPASPEAVETAPPAIPFVVRQEDADELLRTKPDPEPAPPPPAASGRSDVVPLELAPVTNPTSRFVFVDETERPTQRVRSLPERQAAIEAMRQSLGGSKGR